MRHPRFAVGEVLLVHEIKFRMPYIYNVKLENCWIAYCSSEEVEGTFSSLVIVVDCDNGRVLYSGYANDEG